MCNLLKCQAALDVDIDEFDGTPINYHFFTNYYFTAIFKEIVESKIDDRRECLARLVKYTKGEAK